MTDALDYMRGTGRVVPDELLAHTSPLMCEHIGFSGDCRASPSAQSRTRKGGGLIAAAELSERSTLALFN
jgi:hypothetical protein